MVFYLRIINSSLKMKEAICLTYFSSPVTVFSHMFRFVMFSMRQHLSLASYILQPWPIPSSLRPSLSSDNKICPTRFVNFTLYTLIHPFLQRFLVPSIFLYEIFFFLSLSFFIEVHSRLDKYFRTSVPALGKLNQEEYYWQFKAILAYTVKS